MEPRAPRRRDGRRPRRGGAQSPAPGAKIGLQDAIGIALRQSVLVKQSENAVASSENGVSQAKNAFLPSLALSTSSARSVGRAGTSSIGSSSSQSLNTGISSSFTVFDGLRNVNELRQAKLDVAANTNELTRARQTAVFTVASNYLTLATAEGQLAVQKENLAAQEAQEKQLQTLVKAGAARSPISTSSRPPRPPPARASCRPSVTSSSRASR
jgi:outer membrane protein